MAPRVRARWASACLLGALLPGDALADACSAAALERALDSATAAYEAADIDGFSESRDAARRALDCLDELLSSELAAEVHQLEALDSYLPPRNLERAVQSFHAARAAWPGYLPPLALAPEGNLLRVQWEASLDRRDEQVPLPVGRGLRLYVDGRPGEARPTNRPTVLQLVAAGGQVLETRYLAPTAPSPSWEDVVFLGAQPLASSSPDPLVPPPDLPAHLHIPAPPPGPPELPSGRSEALPIALAAGGAAVISGGLWALALSSRADLYRELGNPDEVRLAESERDRVESTSRVINGVGYAAQGTSIIALGLGAGALITWRW